VSSLTEDEEEGEIQSQITEEDNMILSEEETENTSDKKQKQ